MRAKVRDALGNESSVASAGYTRTNAAPTAYAVSNTVSECSTGTNTANATDPRAGDVLTHTRYANGTCTAPVSNTGSAWAIYNGTVGTYSYSYKTTDDDGGVSSCVGATFTFSNIAVTANNFTYGTDIGS